MNTYYDGSYSVYQLNTIGNLDVSNFLKSNGELDSSYSYLDILDGSYSVTDLYSNNIAPQKFANSIYTIGDLSGIYRYTIGDLSGIYSQTDILNVGYNANHYYDYNFSAYELKSNGTDGRYPITFFIDTSYSVQEIFDLNYPVNDLSTSGILVQETIDEYAIAKLERPDGSYNYRSIDISGFFEPHLLLRGYSFETLKSDGFDPSVFALTEFTPYELKYELVIPSNALKETGYPLNTPNLYNGVDGSLNYSIQELKDGGYTNNDFILAINNSLYSPITPISFTLNDLSGSFQYTELGTLDQSGKYNPNANANGISLAYFKINNFDVSYLTNGGSNSTLINDTVFRDKLFQLYYTAQNLYDGGFNIIQVSKAGGIIYNQYQNGYIYQYDLSEVMLIKPPIEELKTALIDLTGWDGVTQLGDEPDDEPPHDITINTLFQYNYSLNEVYGVKNVGRTTGYSIQQIANAGYTIQDFYDNNYELTNGMVLVYPIADILAAGYSIDAINSLQSSNITPGDLLGLGATICQLNVFKTPNRTWTRYQPPVADLSNYSFNDYNMRRKAETLQYRKNSLEYTTKSNNKNILKGREACPITNKPSSSRNSDVPGESIDLYLDANVPLLNFQKKYSYDNNK